MIVACVIATLWPSSLCSMRVYKAEFILRGPRSRELDAVMSAVEPRLTREGFRLEGRMDRKAWWLRGEPGPLEWVSVSVEDGTTQVLLVLHSTRRVSSRFRQERDALAGDLRTVFGEDRVRLSD